MKESPDRLNIQVWAKTRADGLRQDIQDYINLGMGKQKAIDAVLNRSCIGSGIKAQIRYEFR